MADYQISHLSTYMLCACSVVHYTSEIENSEAMKCTQLSLISEFKVGILNR